MTDRQELSSLRELLATSLVDSEKIIVKVGACEGEKQSSCWPAHLQLLVRSWVLPSDGDVDGTKVSTAIGKCGTRVQ